MRNHSKKTSLTLACLMMAGLAACGGGGGGSSGDPTAGGPPPAPAPATVSGIAATGAGFVGGTVQLIDGTGTVVGTSSALGADGAFTITLADGAAAPFVVVATRPGAGGQTETLTSVVSSSTQTVVNVTPVTTLIAALLSPSGDPARLAQELAAGSTQITPAAVAATVEKVQAVLQPLLAATGTATTDPLSGAFAADGTGYDRLLDSLHISIVPTAAGSNVEVAVKQVTDDAGTQPPSVTFNTGAPDSAPPLPAIDPAKLVEAGTSVKIAEFLSGLTACYAIPLADRVNNVSDPAQPAIGEAGDLKAPECRAMFDGGDPANYLSNGGRVGRTASNGGAFASLWRPGATGVVFSQGSYEFTRANGDIVLGYKSRDTLGNETFDTMVVRKDATDGKLRLIGNQYVYSGSVVPYQQVRHFPTLNQSAYDYRSTGYVVNVDNRLDPNGNTIFERVEITAPRGNTLVVKPASGFSYLPLVKNSAVTGTNFVRLRSAFVDPARTESIAAIDPSLFHAAAPYTEAEIAAIPAQAVWTYRFFLAGNTGSTPDAVQLYKTRSRALTIDELAQVKLSEFTPALLADLQANAHPTTGVVPLPNDDMVDYGDPAAGGGWVVPAGALPATSSTVFGKYGNAGFNDAVSFGSTARTARIACVPGSVSDLHCSTGTTPGSFSAGAFATGFHLWARDARGREYANFYATYKLTLP